MCICLVEDLRIDKEQYLTKIGSGFLIKTKKVENVPRKNIPYMKLLLSLPCHISGGRDVMAAATLSQVVLLVTGKIRCTNAVFVS